MPQTPETTRTTHEPRSKHEIALQANVCGAVGCRETDDLVLVAAGNRPNRVLCGTHADSYTRGGR